MTPSELRWWHANVLTKDRYDALLQVYASLEEAWEHMGEELLRGLGCKEETVREVLMRMDDFDPSTLEAELQKRGVTVFSIEDDRYPTLLKEIPDSPVFLSFRGDLSVLGRPCIGLVGTRDMSRYGRRVAEECTQNFCAAGMVTVSGLARGIDSVVAEETLRAKGKTVAVLGGGLAVIHPASHADLAEKIVESGGLLLSEFPLRMEPTKYTFPARNRIIAALSMGTMVIEAPEKSGALITADLALGYHRPVFAVPGQIYDANFAGCHRLIAKGAARLVTSAAEVLTELGMVAPQSGVARPVYQPQSPEEEKILAVLSALPQPVDDIVEKSGLKAADTGATLTMLELSGAAKNVGGGMWIRL